MYIKDKQSLDICQQIYSNRNKNSIRLLNILIWYALRNALVYIKQATLAAQLGLSRQQTNTLLKQLEDSKLITTQYRGVKRTKLYFVNPILFSMALVLGHALSSLTSTSIYFLDSLYPPKKTLFFSAEKPALGHHLTQEENKGVINDQESGWQSSTLVTLPQSTPLNLFNNYELSQTKGCLKGYVTVMHNGQLGSLSQIEGWQPSVGDSQALFFTKNLKEEETLAHSNKLTAEELETVFEIKVTKKDCDMQVSDLKLTPAIAKVNELLGLSLNGQAKLYVFENEIVESALSKWNILEDKKSPYSTFFNRCEFLAKEQQSKIDWSLYNMICKRYNISKSDAYLDGKLKHVSPSMNKYEKSEKPEKSGRLPLYVPPVIELDYDKECEHFYQAVLDGKVFKGYELTYPPFKGWLSEQRKDNPAMITTLEKYLGYKIKFDDEILSDDEMIKELTNLKETLQNIQQQQKPLSTTKSTADIMETVVDNIKIMTTQQYKQTDTFDDGSLIFIDDNFSEDSVFEEIY